MVAVPALPPDYPHVFAEPLRPGLQDRTLGGLVRLPGRTWQVLLLTAGRAEVLAPPEAAGRSPAPRPVEAPALVWWPAARGLRFRVMAGSAGGHLVVDDTALSGAIGVKPAAEDLRLMVQRPVNLSLGEAPGALETAKAAMRLILSETAASARGGDLVIEAQLRVLLVLLWRHGGLEMAAAGGPASAARRLLEFRQSLETHFRERWGVADHARALGMTPDRLHDLCVRSLGRPPKDLIQDRLMHEARLMLLRSSATLDQIAAALGFPHTGHFSRFFRRIEGTPPGAWRRARLASRAAGSPAAGGETSYADWP